MAIIEVKSDITGSIWKILKKVGEAVNEDEPILIMESMKMEIPVTASEAGHIKEITVSDGETVNAGTVVARIDLQS